MARTGRPPKPIEQKRALGNPGKRRLASGVELALVEPVERGPLEFRADELFDQVLGQGVPWLSRTDGPALVILRERLEERQMLRDAVMAGTGDRKALRDLEKQITESLSVLGFDPAARSRLGLAEVKAASKLEQIRASQSQRVARKVGDSDNAG